MSLFVMAQCTSPCGWIGPAHLRKTRGDASEGFCCPQCLGPTKSWVSDLDREQQAIDRDKSARIESTQKANDACRQARLTHDRLRAAQRQTEIARHQVAMLDRADPGFAAKQALLVAEGQEAAAQVAHAHAMAQARALG